MMKKQKKKEKENDLVSSLLERFQIEMEKKLWLAVVLKWVVKRIKSMGGM